MQIEHTPGSWRIDEGGWISTEEIAITEYAECGSHRCQWNNESDKNLVVTAPELLAAVKHALKVEKADLADNELHEGTGANIAANKHNIIIYEKAIQKADGN